MPQPLLPLRRGEFPVFAAFILTLLISAAVALSTGGKEFLFYIIVLVAIAFAVLVVHRRIELTPMTLWALLLWAILHLAGGMVPLPEPTGVLYNFWLIPDRLKYDQVVHAYGFGVAAWVCWQGLRRIVHVSPVSLGVLTLAVLASVGLGAVNEIIEFAATRLVENTNVGDYANNAIDLVANTTGALIAATLIRLQNPPPSTSAL